MLAPERYIVGSGAVDQLAKIIGDLGQRALVLADRMALSVSEKTIAELRSNLKDVYIEEFSGECTEAAIQRTAKMLSGFDVAVCLGGGKAIDTGKAAACTASLPYVTVPTSAATCAAYTPLSILHTDGGAYMESRRLSSPPAALVLDPLLTITAPPRLLSAGVVDAAARAFDTILAARISVPTIEASLSLAICRNYWKDVLLLEAEAALRHNKERNVSELYTRVVETCIVGAGLAGEIGARFFGRSFSHAIGYALGDIVDPGSVLHGEIVGLGILVQCALDPSLEISLTEMRELFGRWDAPTRFARLGVTDIRGSTGRTLAARAYSYLDLVRAVPFGITAEDLYQAMIRVEEEA
jgi:glycerol dehydrogenase